MHKNQKPWILSSCWCLWGPKKGSKSEQKMSKNVRRNMHTFWDHFWSVFDTLWPSKMWFFIWGYARIRFSSFSVFDRCWDHFWYQKWIHVCPFWWPKRRPNIQHVGTYCPHGAPRCPNEAQWGTCGPLWRPSGARRVPNWGLMAPKCVPFASLWALFGRRRWTKYEHHRPRRPNQSKNGLPKNQTYKKRGARGAKWLKTRLQNQIN